MANLFCIVFNFFIGMAGPITCLVLRLIAADPANPKSSLKKAAVAIEWILRFIPSFCLGRGLLFNINIDFFELVEAKKLTAWSEVVSRWDVVFLGLKSVFYILITIFIDIQSTKPKSVVMFQKVVDFLTFKWLCSKDNQERIAVVENEDEDVIAENSRVLSGQADSDLIVIKDLEN